MDVSVIIPAYNECDRIAATIQAIRSIPEVSEIVVVDDGSSDHTAKLAKTAGATVIRHCRNYGKGRALTTGLEGTRSPVVVFADADLGETATQIRLLITPILQGEADMTVARFPQKRAGKGFGIVKWLAKLGIRRLTGLTIDSPLSGQRALHRHIVERVSFATGYGVEVGLTVDALLHGWRIVEVPVQMSHREYGKSVKGLWHRARQMIQIAKVLAERGGSR